MDEFSLPQAVKKLSCLFPYLFPSVFSVKSAAELMVSTWHGAAFIGLEAFCGYGKQVLCYEVAVSIIQVKCFEGRVKFLAPCATFKSWTGRMM